jgi:hypothetical protein
MQPVPQAAASPAVVRLPARTKLRKATIMNESTTHTEIELLRSYASGPRIWDATALEDAVFNLAEAGLIEPDPGNSSSWAFRLTDAGRERLRQLDGSTS